MSPQKELLTVDEFVDELRKKGVQVHPNTVRNWIRSGQLKHRRIGRPYYIFTSEVDRLTQKPNGEDLGNSLPVSIARAFQTA